MTLKVRFPLITIISLPDMARKFKDNKKKNRHETIELALPKFGSEELAAKGDDVWERFPTTIQKITDWFKQYQVDSIELWISGVLETGTITRLVVSAKGEGGMKVVLKTSALSRARIPHFGLFGSYMS